MVVDAIIDALMVKWSVPKFIADQIKGSSTMVQNLITSNTDDKVEDFLRHIMQLTMLAMDSEVPIEQFQEQVNETVRHYKK